MSNWEVVPCLLTLRNEYNYVSPRRDKGADGTIADSEHSKASDHYADEDSSILRSKDADKENEVHALDVDSAGPWPTETWFEGSVEKVRLQQIKDRDNCRLEYIILNGRICSRTKGWVWRPYDGKDKHFNHAHFSARYLTRTEKDTRPWGVANKKEEEMLVQEGDRSEEVKYWQEILNTVVGSKLDVDGIYGPEMTKVVNADRKKRGTGTHTMITAWHGLRLQKDYFSK